MTTALSRLPLVDRPLATGSLKTVLDGVQKQLGGVPNFLLALANSPPALEGVLALSGKLGAGALDPKIAERVALVLAETNSCDYCVSAHSSLADRVGLDEEEILAARRGGSSDAKADAAVRFAKSVVENRGDVTTAELGALRDVGFSEGEIIEIIAHVGLNTLNNYIGRIGQIEIDFPKAPALDATS